MKLYAFFLFFFFSSFLLKAQTQPLNAAEIALGLAKLNVKGSVLYVAAHPDDENTRLLAYLAKEIKVKTGYLSITRGDGGQNLIGNEQAELLGLIRTQELLAARKIDGAEQFFTRANDFGFSKTSEESFKIWGKEQILADVVWIIRTFKPDVIITRFPEDSRAGHGHHAGSAILAREAFVAAADPNRFTGQLKFTQVWQAKRIVWNSFAGGNSNNSTTQQLKIDVGLFNSLLGKSYGEIAAISRSNHKSQGFGATLQRGEAIENFTYIAGDTAKNDLFEGINLSIGNNKNQQLLNKIIANYQVNKPWLSLPDLLQLKKEVNGTLFNHQLLTDLILACAGIWVDVTATEVAYAAGDSIPIKIQAIARAQANFPLAISLVIANQSPNVLLPNKLFIANQKIISLASNGTQPYWLKKNHPIGQYIITNQQGVGFAENSNPLNLEFLLTINGEELKFNRDVVYKYTDPIRGELYQPLVLAPQVTATLSKKAYIFNGNTPKNISVQLKAFNDNCVGWILPQLPKGWKTNPEKIAFNLASKGDEQNITFEITPNGVLNTGDLLLQVNTNGTVDDKGLKTINYDHIPNLTIFPQAIAKLEKIDIKIVGKRIAYIAGAGDLVADNLKEIGFEITQLTPEQILIVDLSNFDAIITGVRLYNINPAVKTMQPKLLAFVKNGGTLLMQYNVNNGLKSTEFGPYPFKLSNKRVTEENSKVQFLAPNHPALNYPNKITQQDFNGWVQERGLYFATAIDPKYSSILSMNDTGEAANDGALLVADYGKGKFVYTALAFFRELPAGVPGAFRLFVNLLAPKQPL